MEWTVPGDKVPSRQLQATLQAVILVLDRGNERMSVLTQSVPKGMLLIANRPLLFYQLLALERAGIEDVLVVSTTTWESKVFTYATELYGADELVQQLRDSADVKPTMKIRTLAVDDGLDTGDALRETMSLVSGDVLVLHDDLLFSESYLFTLVDAQRAAEATTLLFLTVPEPQDAKKPKRPETVDLTAFGSRHGDFKHRKHETVLMIHPEAEEDEMMSVSAQAMYFSPEIKVRRDLLDSHLYLLTRPALQHIDAHRKLSSLSGEIVPDLVKRQLKLYSDGRHPQRVVNNENHAHSNSRHDQPEIAVDQSSTLCIATILPPSATARRIDSVAEYTEANRAVAAGLLSSVTDSNCRQDLDVGEGAKVGADSTLGRHVRIGAKSVIKKCIIGSHTVIGADVRISNCIVMDHAKIGDGCKITGGVVGSSAQLGERTTLKDCNIATAATVAGGQELEASEIRAES